MVAPGPGLAPPLVADDTPRVAELRRQVRSAMDKPPETWTCPRKIDDRFMSEPIAVRKGQFQHCADDKERAFIESVLIATDGLMDFALRLALRCDAEAAEAPGDRRAGKLRRMAAKRHQAG